MVSDLTGLFDGPFLIVIWAFAIAFAGGPLLWKFLEERPVTRCAVVHGASNAVGTGCWLTFGSAAIRAFERGLVSLPESIVAVALLSVVLAGCSFLVARWCPDQEQ